MTLVNPQPVLGREAMTPDAPSGRAERVWAGYALAAHVGTTQASARSCKAGSPVVGCLVASTVAEARPRMGGQGAVVRSEIVEDVANGGLNGLSGVTPITAAIARCHQMPG